MARLGGQGAGSHPVPWWAQQAFRHRSDDFDTGTYESKEAAFTSNALYRYWHTVGVKDHRQESGSRTIRPGRSGSP